MNRVPPSLALCCGLFPQEHRQHPRNTGLRAAADTGRLEVVKALLARGASVDFVGCPDVRRESAKTTAPHPSAAFLLSATLACRQALACALIYTSASPPVSIPQCADGRTPILAAAHAGHLAVLDHLVSAGASVHHADKSGWNAAHLAAAGGRLECLERLLALGVSLEGTKSKAREIVRGRRGLSCLHTVFCLLRTRAATASNPATGFEAKRSTSLVAAAPSRLSSSRAHR